MCIFRLPLCEAVCSGKFHLLFVLLLCKTAVTLCDLVVTLFSNFPHNNVLQAPAVNTTLGHTEGFGRGGAAVTCGSERSGKGSVMENGD